MESVSCECCNVQISHGPTYTMKVTGTCVQPGLQFSTTSHDFGVCFVARLDLPVQSVVLKLTNVDIKDIRYNLCVAIYRVHQ